MIFKKLVEKIDLIVWWFRYRKFDKEIWEENKSLSNENLELLKENNECFKQIWQLEDKNDELWWQIHDRDLENDKLNYHLIDEEEKARRYEEALMEIAKLTIGFDATSKTECVDVIHKVRMQVPEWIFATFEG